LPISLASSSKSANSSPIHPTSSTAPTDPTGLKAEYYLPGPALESLGHPFTGAKVICSITQS
jgi:hypothetical protein